MNILLVTPPLTQLNTPYPATTVLKGFLSKNAQTVYQCDLGIELVNRIYTKKGLTELQLPDDYINTIDAVVQFLQGKDKTLATRIANGTLLPEGPRFKNTANFEWAFGTSCMNDLALHLATLYIEDIADYIRENNSPHFDLIRYAEQISMSAPTFDKIEKEIENPAPSLIDGWMLELLDKKIKDLVPQLIGFSIPFPGCLYSALKCAQYIKKQYPNIKIVIGGGYVNTELRSMTDKRIFNYIDYALLDDGELSLLNLIKYLENKCSEEELIRCFYLDANNSLVYSGNDSKNLPFIECGTPDFSDLPLDKYWSLMELTNPMHRLWTDGLWNKMTVAHGCYWAKCAFCDTNLDYIKRYDAPDAITVIDKMEKIMKQTGQSGFHFTDEALPPKLLKEMALEIIRRKKIFSYWGNVRFEKAFTADLCSLLAQSGCIAVSGGLEVASDRILKLINKGVSISQAAQSCRNLTESGIMVHAYLMYGFPTETMQETVDSLEVVRQLFDEGLIQSAFWHRYTMTIHSPSGTFPEKFGAKRIDAEFHLPVSHPFANNGIDFTDNQTIDLDALGAGLYKATYNFMHGIGLDLPLQDWFEIKIPKTSIRQSVVV